MEVVVAGELDVVRDGVGGGGWVELEVFVVGVVDFVGEGVVAFGAGWGGHFGREGESVGIFVLVCFLQGYVVLALKMDVFNQRFVHLLLLPLMTIFMGPMLSYLIGVMAVAGARVYVRLTYASDGNMKRPDMKLSGLMSDITSVLALAKLSSVPRYPELEQVVCLHLRSEPKGSCDTSKTR